MKCLSLISRKEPFPGIETEALASQNNPRLYVDLPAVRRYAGKPGSVLRRNA